MRPAPLAFAVGVVTWPALEYALHRGLGHTLKAETRFKREHREHHRSGDYFAPGAAKLLAALPAAAALWLAALAATRLPGAAAAYTAGFLCCYLAYELTHKRFHTHPPLTALGLTLRKHHFLHHFVDPRRNHGVTTRLFDRLFGTFASRDQIPVPRALAPRWLVDGTGIAADYREHFRLV